MSYQTIVEQLEVLATVVENNGEKNIARRLRKACTLIERTKSLEARVSELEDDLAVLADAVDELQSHRRGRKPGWLKEVS